MATTSEHRARARFAIRDALAELDVSDELLQEALEAARPHLAGWLAGEVHDSLVAQIDATSPRLPLTTKRPIDRPEPGEHLWAVTGQWPLREHEILQAGLADVAHCALCHGHYGLVGRHLCHANLIRTQAEVDSSART